MCHCLANLCGASDNAVNATASDSRIRVEVWPHICVEDCYGFVCVSNLCPVQFHLDVRFVHAELSILVYVKVRVQARNIVHVTIRSVQFYIRDGLGLNSWAYVRVGLMLKKRFAFVSNSRSC